MEGRNDGLKRMWVGSKCLIRTTDRLKNRTGAVAISWAQEGKVWSEQCVAAPTLKGVPHPKMEDTGVVEDSDSD